MASDLDRVARGRLRTLSKENADGVARHLVMAGRLVDEEPELAYEHAQAAVRRAGRVDVVREAAGLTAYRTGRFAEALRELRTVRRLNGSSEHLAIMADCERGLGRPERALALALEDGAGELSTESAVELALVVAGARLDLEQPDAAMMVLQAPVVLGATGELAERVAGVRADVLDALGRTEEANALRATLPDVDEEIVVVDLTEEEDAPVSEDATSPTGGPDAAEH
ncbi:hypothetical protein [Actinotalea sp.]|uniref:hypothetical protein n=1 Tax=Actinotalea sp. TaxID=1872145 RepID=UPI003565A2BE